MDSEFKRTYFFRFLIMKSLKSNFENRLRFKRFEPKKGKNVFKYV